MHISISVLGDWAPTVAQPEATFMLSFDAGPRQRGLSISGAGGLLPGVLNSVPAAPPNGKPNKRSGQRGGGPVPAPAPSASDHLGELSPPEWRWLL